MTIEQANKRAKEILSRYTTSQLLEQWEILCTKETTIDVINARGWLLDALEEREPQKMEKFYDDLSAKDTDLRKYLS